MILSHSFQFQQFRAAQNITLSAGLVAYTEEWRYGQFERTWSLKNIF